MYDDTAEILKPSIDSQKSIKKSIDEKRDKLIEQLQKNQKAITSGLEDIVMINTSPALPAPIETTKLPMDYKPIMMDDIDGKPEEKPLYKSDIDQGFTPDEIKKLIDYKLPPPSQILKSHLDGSIDIDDYDKEIGKNSKISEERKDNCRELEKIEIKTKNKLMV